MPRPISAPRPRTRPRASVPPVDPVRYAPTPQRPLRVKLRHLAADTDIQPHSHAWAQIAISETGVLRTTAGSSTYLVPPSRALWIPSGVEHVVQVVEAADIRTLYLHQPEQRHGPDVPPEQESAWSQCRVLELSNLLRELVRQLPVDSDLGPPTPREQLLSALILDELRRAQTVRIGIELPADKRLRSLCTAVLDDPARYATLDEWAAATGASTRTVARLFRSELGTTYVRWRQQVLLAKALTLAARGRPIGVIAGELGYASPSAFSAMVTRTVGLPPARFFGQAQ